MRFISLIVAIFWLAPVSAQANKLPRFATKLSMDGLRYISRDGKYSYAQKRSGALSLVADFKSRDIIEGPPGTNYHVTSSSARKKVIIEVERAWHQEMDLTKLHEIWVAPLGSTNIVSVGKGRVPRLHLDDDWVTFYDPKSQSIHVQFLPVAKRHFVIRLNRKHNPFFMPEVLMLNPEVVLYTDINNKGHAALLSYNLVDNKVTVMNKAEKSGTRMELCSFGKYAALGEFSYPEAKRGSSIRIMAWKVVAGLGGFAQMYQTTDNDLGQMSCADGKVWFVKTVTEDFSTNNQVTEAASLDVLKGKVEIHSSLNRVSNLINMDGRILLPFREDIFVLEGDPGTRQDQLERPQGLAP